MADHGFDLIEVQQKLGGHSVFAPSASAMWLACSGSLIANLLADDNAGEDAAYGTVAHGVAELWLNTGTRPDHLIGEVEPVDQGHEVFQIEIDAVMLDYVEEYVDWCRMLPGDLYVEQRVDFSQLTPIPNQGGTADHIACQPGVLTITDLKMGKGVQVFAKGNTQALIYALGAFYRWDWEYGFQRIVIRIAQPRLGHFDVWEVDREFLLQFAEFVKERAYAAWQSNAPRVAGEKQCQWCKVRRDCTTLAAYMIQITDGVFDDLEGQLESPDVVRLVERLDDEFEEFHVKPTPVHTLTLAHKAKIIKYRKVMENWLKSIEDELEKILQSGGRVPDYKLVQGRANRFFPDSAKAASSLSMLSGLDESEFLTTEIASPAQVEEILRKKCGYKRADIPKLMDGLSVKPKGKPVMAPAHDKRAEITVGDGDVFGDLEAESTDDDL